MTLEGNRHPNPNSKMVGGHLFCLMPNSVNKLELTTVQETQTRKKLAENP